MDTELFIEILLLAIAVYLAFFKSYLTEKGKSAALREDIADLTREVESVKDEFSKEQLILKTDMDRILSNEVSYRNEERNAIIQFHGTITEWVYSILEVVYSAYTKTNIDSLIEKRNINSSFYSKTGIAKSKVDLLVEDKKLISAAGNLYIAILEFHHWTDKEFLKLQQNCERQKSLTERFLIVIKDFERNKDIANDMAKEETIMREEAKALLDNYMANRNEEYSKVLLYENDFTSLVKQYLKK